MYIRRFRDVKVVREVRRRVRRGRLKKWRMVRKEWSVLFFAAGDDFGADGSRSGLGSSRNQIIEGP